MKRCAIIWCMRWAGPTFFECTPDGRILGDVPELSEKIRNGYSYDIDRTDYSTFLLRTAEEAGYQIYYSDYDTSFKPMRLRANGPDELYLTEDDSLSLADELKRLMLQGPVHFKYRKVGKPEKVNKRTGVVTPAIPGEVREAHGTLSYDIIGKTLGQIEKAAENHKVPNDHVQVYFDIDSNGWRSFRKENLIEIID